LLSKVALLALGLIAEGPINPYFISKILKYEPNNAKFSNIPTSTIYEAVNMLKEKQYISGKKEKNGNMPDKTVYRITRLGSRILQDSLQSYLSLPEASLTEFDAAIIMICHLDKEKATLALQNYRKRLQAGIISRQQLYKLQEKRGVPYTGLIAIEHVINRQKLNLKTVDKLLDHIQKDEKWNHFPAPVWKEMASRKLSAQSAKVSPES
jgi:DNA-binding PadR family transcriptional regulator